MYQNVGHYEFNHSTNYVFIFLLASFPFDNLQIRILTSLNSNWHLKRKAKPEPLRNTQTIQGVESMSWSLISLLLFIKISTFSFSVNSHFCIFYLYYCLLKSPFSYFLQINSHFFHLLSILLFIKISIFYICLISSLRPKLVPSGLWEREKFNGAQINSSPWSALNQVKIELCDGVRITFRVIQYQRQTIPMG